MKHHPVKSYCLKKDLIPLMNLGQDLFEYIWITQASGQRDRKSVRNMCWLISNFITVLMKRKGTHSRLKVKLPSWHEHPSILRDIGFNMFKVLPSGAVYD